MTKSKYDYEFEDMENMHPVSAGKHVFKGLLIGSLVGAATMLLLAPRSGQETRAEIRDKAIELRDRTNETVSQAKTKAQELKETVRDRALEMKQQGKQTARQQLERASDALETSKERVREY
jgi:gas vesicle protein